MALTRGELVRDVKKGVFVMGARVTGWAVVAVFACHVLAAQDLSATRIVRPPSSPQAAAGAQSSGNVILERSAVFILVGKTGLGHEHGVIGRLQAGQVSLGRSKDAGQLVFSMATFDADSPEARQYVGLKGETNENTRKQVNANMLGKDVLNVAKFPTASLIIDSALQLAPAPGASPTRYELSGFFTLQGVTKPLKLTCEATPQKDGVRLTTGFAVRQSDYGIKPYSAALGAVGVADELKIWGDLLLAADGR
jgi:hypothetical protein